MKIASIVSTKGGPGKTTATADPGAFCADANLKTLLIDLDIQPSLSSFYHVDLLASDLVISPITLDMLAAREF